MAVEGLLGDLAQEVCQHMRVAQHRCLELGPHPFTCGWLSTACLELGPHVEGARTPLWDNGSPPVATRMVNNGLITQWAP